MQQFKPFKNAKKHLKNGSLTISAGGNFPLGHTPFPGYGTYGLGQVGNGSTDIRLNVPFAAHAHKSVGGNSSTRLGPGTKPEIFI
jgi:hypothetical protein